MIDWTFRVADLMTIGTLLIGGLGFLFRLENQNRAADATRKADYEGLSAAVKKVEGQMETLATALVKIAVQDERLKSHGSRIAILEADVRRLERRDPVNDVAAG